MLWNIASTLEHTSGNSCRLNWSTPVTEFTAAKFWVWNTQFYSVRASPSVRLESCTVQPRMPPAGFLLGHIQMASHEPTYPMSQPGSSKEILRQTSLRAGHGQPRHLLEILWPVSLLGVTMPLTLWATLPATRITNHSWFIKSVRYAWLMDIPWWGSELTGILRILPAEQQSNLLFWLLSANLPSHYAISSCYISE